MATTFDVNKWYYMTVASLDGLDFRSTVLYANSGTTGAIYFDFLPSSGFSNLFMWQIVPASHDGHDDVYVLRTQAGGAGAYFAIRSPGAVNETYPLLIKYSVVDDSEIFWRITPWGDGTYYFSNLANGTDLHLAENKGQVIMTNNTAKVDIQRFTIGDTKIPVNNDKFSTLQIRSATSIIGESTSSTSTPTPTPTGSGTATTTPSPGEASATPPSSSASAAPSSSSGLSNNAIIAIAVSVTGLVVLVVAMVVFYKMSKRRTAQQQQQQQQHYWPTNPQHNTKYFYELPNHQPPGELPTQTAADIPHELYAPLPAHEGRS